MLIDSLSYLLAYTNVITWYQMLAIALLVVASVYFVTPEPPDYWGERQPPTLYFYLQWSWLGYLRLKDAFWPFFILFNATLLYIDYRIEDDSFTIASWVTMHIIMAMPLIYWTGAVWRCSRQCASKRWVVAARSLTVAAYIDYALRWVIYHDFPNILFNCQQLINHWGDCV
ncbi:MAG: hypothetical protein KGZ80_00635 [Methylomonas sp.]|nr:hypothetical protein [Methylomonas sp.]PPD21122.1 MAG: hypothetical protein CTY23_06430 [Methylomonas sp.]PPD27556.1 MAG: hypothetical protein CTY22_01460 [Methylomonas sp.]PPD39552.1 MAG: hypothetical protein CTY21_01455 [Methylomonas sp.]PPD55803.1 MAG: hypothetical protein CTY11_00725 [Methylomonas sp.]